MEGVGRRMAYKLSPSSLSLMKECPRCFWLTHHGVWKRPAGIFPSLPNGMDSILKKHFDKFCEKGLLPPELCENKECAQLKLFDDFTKLKSWRNNREGISWGDKEGNILHGAIDNLLVKSGKLVVLDYKTKGFPLKNDINVGEDYYQLQMDIYNYLLRKNGYDTEDFSLLLYYIPREVTSTGEFLFDTTIKKLSVSVKNAEDVWRKALTLLNTTCPNKKCAWCERI